MTSSLTAFSALAILASLLPSTSAHMAVFDASVYGINKANGIETPMSGLPFNQWWFHGNAGDKPSEVKTITAGKPLTLEISCRKEHSTFGNKPSTDACPIDGGAYHAGAKSFVDLGWSTNSEDSLMGCALAIAPTKDAASTKPEDFVVMSILERCVRQRDTTFAIPANLPSCPDGECTCAWFWQGKNSQDEMYMTGFRCKVEGGTATPFPKPAEPRRNAVSSGAFQPAYWANSLNNVGYAPNFENKPSYNSKWGWKDGAQTSAFGAGGAAAPVAAGTSRVAAPAVEATTRAGAARPAATAAEPISTLPDENDDEAVTPPASSDRPVRIPDEANAKVAPNPEVATSTRRRRPRPTGAGGSGQPGGANNYAAVQSAGAPVEGVDAPMESQAGAPGAGKGKGDCHKKERRSRVHA